MNKIGKIIKHFRNRTVFDRVMQTLRPFWRAKRTAWWNKKIIKKGEIVHKIYPGVKMFLYDNCLLSEAIFTTGFEQQEIKLMTKILRKGDIFLDIGSNYGIYSLIAARKVCPSGKVYAIEPVAKTFERLERNIKLNKFKNIFPFRLAVSSSNGTLPMKISQEGYDAWNSLAKPTRGDNYDIEIVETQRLDDFIQANKLMGKIKMVKIDVEGWEYEVLNGGLEFFSEQGVLIVQIEFNEDALQGAGSSSEMLIKKLTSLGYKLYKYDGQKNEFISFIYNNENLDTNLFATNNLELVNQLVSEGGNKPLCSSRK